MLMKPETVVHVRYCADWYGPGNYGVVRPLEIALAGNRACCKRGDATIKWAILFIGNEEDCTKFLSEFSKSRWTNDINHG